MADPVPAAPRYRYPLHAVLPVAGASLLFAVELGLGALLLMPLVPLVPVFITFMLGNACLLASALQYAVENRVELPSAPNPARTSPHESRVEAAQS
jgi:hypothetical protein